MKLVSEIHTELTRMCITGAAPDQAIKTIAKKMNTSRYNAGRLVMTEAAYFSSVAEKDSFSDLGVEQYEILATLDSHTSAICQEMDGKVFDMKDYEAGVTAPPFHVWCRSTTVPYFNDGFTAGEMRAARGADGKTYHVPADMKYPEWKKQFTEGGKPKTEEIKADDSEKQKRYAERRKAYKERAKKRDAEKQKDELIDRNYKELSLEEFKEMHHNVSKEERSILYGKSHFSGYINSSNARKLNGQLRQGEELSGNYKEIADVLSEVIQKNTIPMDIVVKRFIDTDALEPITGVAFPKPPGLLAKKDAIEQYWEDISDLKNKIPKDHQYIEKGFLSTSGVVDKNVFERRKICLNIKVPKGTKAYITTNYRESEIILDRNTRLGIIETRIENGGTSDVKFILECIVR